MMTVRHAIVASPGLVHPVYLNVEISTVDNKYFVTGQLTTFGAPSKFSKTSFTT